MPGLGWLAALKLWLRARLRPDLVERDLNDELRYHIERQTEEHVARGMSPQAAHELSIDQLGGVEAVKARNRRAADEGFDLAMEDWRSDSMLPRMFNLKTLVFASVAAGALVGFVAAKKRAPLYQSQAVIQVIPPQIAGETSAQATFPLRLRLEATKQTILSRTRLQRMIEQFDLYPPATSSVIMEERVEEMRSNIDIGPPSASGTFTVRFTGVNPVTVMKVTEQLAGWIRGENSKNGERAAQDTTSFLESQADEVGRRIDQQQAAAKASGSLTSRRVQLETQVLEATYTRLLTSLEEARRSVNIERRQIGEQFVLLDAARLPEKPITPTVLEQTWRGAVAGLLVGVILSAAVIVRRIWKNRPPRPSMQEIQ